jgi:VIT1/CCC1 family predicted Fe2+/Mn2+ transporter
MSDINDGHGIAAAAGATFPVAIYVLFPISYLALVLVTCLDLMHVLSLVCMYGMYARSYVMLLLVVKYT